MQHRVCLYVDFYKIYDVYIYWKTKYIRTKMQQHNSGIRLVETEPFYLWTYALLVYILWI